LLIDRERDACPWQPSGSSIAMDRNPTPSHAGPSVLAATPTMLRGTQDIDMAVYWSLTSCYSAKSLNLFKSVEMIHKYTTPVLRFNERFKGHVRIWQLFRAAAIEDRDRYVRRGALEHLARERGEDPATWQLIPKLRWMRLRWKCSRQHAVC
jgi:hypothetical protein